MLFGRLDEASGCELSRQPGYPWKHTWVFIDSPVHIYIYICKAVFGPKTHSCSSNSCENRKSDFTVLRNFLINQLSCKPLLPPSPEAAQRAFTSLACGAPLPPSAIAWRQSVLVHLDGTRRTATKSQCVSSDHEAAVGAAPMATLWVLTPPCRVKIGFEATYGWCKNKNGWGGNLDEFYKELLGNKMPKKYQLIFSK